MKALPFLEELMANSDDGRKKLDKALVEAEIAENNFIDVQLICSSITINSIWKRRLQCSEFKWDTASVEFKLSDSELENAKIEFTNAKESTTWANIDLLPSQVNALTAEYFQADALCYRVFADGYTLWMFPPNRYICR